MSGPGRRCCWTNCPSIVLGIVLVATATPMPAASAAFTSSYMDIDEECDVSDDGYDVFSFSCVGPSGVYAWLIYVEGEALISYEIAEDVRLQMPFLVGGEGRIFGKLLEWRGRMGAAPCAAIIRTATRVGSRLAVVALDENAAAPTMAMTNEQAHATADAFCEGRKPERSKWEPFSKAEMLPEFVGTYAPPGQCDGNNLIELSMTGMRRQLGRDVIQFEGLEVSYSYAGDEDVVTIFPRDESADAYPFRLAMSTGSPKTSLELSDGLGDGYRLSALGNAAMVKC